MNDNLIEIDSAMNMIKEEITRELSECVSRQNKDIYFNNISSKRISYSDSMTD